MTERMIWGTSTVRQYVRCWSVRAERSEGQSGGRKADGAASRLFSVGPLSLLLFVLLAVAPPAVFATERGPVIRVTDHLAIGMTTQRMFASHTSYEFGNPFAPTQNPLSRLEFPLDSWWAGVELRATFPRVSFGGEALTNLSQETGRWMQDSDWDDEENPRRKTIFSKSRCRLESSYLVRADIDLRVSDWLGLPEWLDLRPVAGFRRQEFNLTTHDGTQWDVADPEPISLPGDGIAFDQAYSHYFLGMRAGLDLGRYVKLRSLTALLQLDWAYVEGRNRDRHLLRDGQRFTYEETYGQAWHGSIGLQAGLTERLSLAAEADVLTLSTTGSHRLVNSTFDIDFIFSDGVKVWSDQNRLSLQLRYSF